MCTGGDYPKGADMTEVQTSTKCLFYCAASALRSRWPKYKVMVPHAAECKVCCDKLCYYVIVKRTHASLWWFGGCGCVVTRIMNVT